MIDEEKQMDLPFDGDDPGEPENVFYTQHEYRGGIGQ